MNYFTPAKLKALWKVEYEKQGMPSSYRNHPSGSVVWFLSYLHEVGVYNGKVIDIGCGKGRNSVYLADAGFTVSSMDIVPEAVEEVLKKAEAAKIAASITCVCHDIGTPWPFKDAEFDIAVDTFCYKHQVNDSTRINYHEEIRRTLKPGGYFLITTAGLDDGYYGTFLAQSPDPEKRLIFDPENGLGSILFNENHLIDEFSDGFEVMYYQHKRNSFLMHGDTYKRSTHLLVLRKNL